MAKYARIVEHAVNRALRDRRAELGSAEFEGLEWIVQAEDLQQVQLQFDLMCVTYRDTYALLHIRRYIRGFVDFGDRHARAASLPTPWYPVQGILEMESMGEFFCGLLYRSIEVRASYHGAHSTRCNQERFEKRVVAMAAEVLLREDVDVSA